MESTLTVLIPPGEGLGRLLRPKVGGRIRDMDDAQAKWCQEQFWKHQRPLDEIAKELCVGARAVRGVVTTLSSVNLLDIVLDLSRMPESSVDRPAAASRSVRGAGLACIKAQLAADVFDDHWLDWPHGRGPQDRPYVTWPKHPESGKRWTGPAVIVAWFLLYGGWPQGQLNHRLSCNQAECWNPEHVYDGTAGQNALDLRLAASMAAEQQPNPARSQQAAD